MCITFVAIHYRTMMSNLGKLFSNLTKKYHILFNDPKDVDDNVPGIRRSGEDDDADDNNNHMILMTK